MDDVTWSTEWKRDLSTWLSASRGDWESLAETLGSEGPKHVPGSPTSESPERTERKASGVQKDNSHVED